MNTPAAPRAVLQDWLAGQPLGLAATLTFVPRLPAVAGYPPRRLSVTEASKCVRVYLRRLDRLAYGNATKRGRRLAAAVVQEGGDGANAKHVHYHLALEVPAGIPPEDWARRAAAIWVTMDWASPTQNVFKPMWSRDWIGYILKDRDKPNYFDAMDIESWHRV